MEKARCNTELYSNLRGPLNNVKPSNFLGSHQRRLAVFFDILYSDIGIVVRVSNAKIVN